MTPAAPKVSVCIPTYNGSRWIEETLRSALEQTYEPLEVVVVDDASTDDTVARVRAFQDPRVRVIINSVNLGLVGNWNRSIGEARGELVKFLFQDDILYPSCIERMVALMQTGPRIGMVFARRDMLLEDPHDAASKDWLEAYADVHSHFSSLGETNAGRDLFEQCLKMGFRINVVGEPSSVMVRRDCFERVGLFNTRMHQATDLEMWVRLMLFYDVGFIDEPLTQFRFHARSTTFANHHDNRSWLDMLWLLEGLLSYKEVRDSYPEVSRLRRVETARAFKTTLTRLKRRLPVSLRQHGHAMGEYGRYRLEQLLRRDPAIRG
jgi:glycosyltransferase involved in cell wall biosynthesis